MVMCLNSFSVKVTLVIFNAVSFWQKSFAEQAPAVLFQISENRTPLAIENLMLSYD